MYTSITSGGSYLKAWDEPVMMDARNVLIGLKMIILIVDWKMESYIYI